MITHHGKAGVCLKTAALALTLALTGCEAELRESPFTVDQFIARVTDASGTIVATLHEGTPPAPNGGPTSTVSGFAAMVTGGSAQQSISAASFNTVIVSSPGMRNWYELVLPAGVSAADFILQAAQDIGSTNVNLAYAVEDAGAVGPYVNQSVRVIGVGTGDVQVSVSWSDSSDVDLHVVDPSGEEIYFGNRQSQSGGQLDLDSNAACSRDPDNTHKSNENIVWPVGGGMSGTYTVRLAYWSSCNVSAPTQYVVTVATAGGVAQVFTGEFTGSGTGGGAGAGTLITTFDF